MLVFVVTVGLSVAFLTKRPKLIVKEVLADGSLEMTDARRVTLAGVRLHREGELKHEAGIFLLTEITKNVEVWLESQGDGYRLWIGCRNMLWMRDCKNGVLVNEELIKAGVAERI